MGHQPNGKDEDLRFRLGAEELRFIRDLRGRLDRNAALAEAVKQYRRLGWNLVLWDPATGAEMEVNRFEEEWPEHLLSLAFQRSQVVLGVKAGAGLLVAEMAAEQPPGAPDHELFAGGLRAFSDQGRQRYFFRQPQCRCLLPRQWGPIRFYAAGERVILPPSVDPATGEAWEWAEPPWVTAPASPGPALLHLLAAPGPPGADASPPAGIPSWKRIFPVVVCHTGVLQALLAPAATAEDYYRLILRRALAAGITEAAILVGLLWHAPFGPLRRGEADVRKMRALIADCLFSLVHPAQENHHCGPPAGQALSSALAHLSHKLRTPGTVSAPEGSADEIPAAQEKREAQVQAAPEAVGGGMRGLAPDLKARIRRLADPAFAADPQKMAMLEYYLKNYISLNPDWAHLDAEQQVLAAQKMAKEFFGLHG